MIFQQNEMVYSIKQKRVEEQQEEQEEDNRECHLVRFFSILNSSKLNDS